MASTTYSISDLAKEFDLTTRAIRFYEDMGLLQPQREGPGGRSRVYTARDRTRLKLTLRAKRLGLSLTEAREIIDTYDSPRDTGPQLTKILAVQAPHRSQDLVIADCYRGATGIVQRREGKGRSGCVADRERNRARIRCEAGKQRAQLFERVGLKLRET